MSKHLEDIITSTKDIIDSIYTYVCETSNNIYSKILHYGSKVINYVKDHPNLIPDFALGGLLGGLVIYRAYLDINSHFIPAFAHDFPAHFLLGFVPARIAYNIARERGLNVARSLLIGATAGIAATAGVEITQYAIMNSNGAEIVDIISGSLGSVIGPLERYFSSKP